jgi:hypothetical protein
MVQRISTLTLIACLAAGSASAAAGEAAVTQITPNVLMFATSSGNVVASVGPDGALLVGTPSAASTSQISSVLSGQTKSPLRYVVVFPEDLAHSQGDAGWGARGAFVAMQEHALDRLGGHAMGPARSLPPQLTTIGVDRPRIAFSEVLTFDLNGEAIHIVHQPPGYSNADAIAHFHVANLVYLGEIFPGDGYPKIDVAQGGKLEGLVKTLDEWTGDRFRVVPARGAVANGNDVKAFHDMILAVRERVNGMITAGRTEDEIVTSHPTASFDARWGSGRVRPDEFVREVYTSLKKQ